MRGVSVAAWAKGCSAINLFKSSDFEVTLEETGNFPSFESVRETLAAYNLEGIFSEKDVLQNLLLIMHRALAVADEFGTEVLRVSGIRHEVQCMFERHPAALREASIRSLATLAWLKHVGFLKPCHFLVSGNPAMKTGSLCFEGSIDDALWNGGVAPQLPETVSVEVPTISSADDCISVVTALDVWRSTNTPAELHLAIYTKACRLAETTGAPRSSLRAFRIGSEFLGSLTINQAVRGRYASSTLEACARIVLGSPKYEVKDFGGARADGMAGKRTHITKHVAALRLMYWTSTEGDIEFANVGPKGELIIECGDESEATAVDYPSTEES
jgi:hypothetical protein